MDNSLVRGLIVGLFLAAGAIGLFFLLYFVVFESADAAIRLFASLCSPPIVLGVIIGGYFILTQDDKSEQ
ncbi:MAG: hypothetical protein AAFV93_21720 [Chloroflexota bacterium]